MQLERSPTTPHLERCDIYGFGGMLEPRYIYGADNLDQ